MLKAFFFNLGESRLVNSYIQRTPLLSHLFCRWLRFVKLFFVELQAMFSVVGIYKQWQLKQNLYLFIFKLNFIVNPWEFY